MILRKLSKSSNSAANACMPSPESAIRDGFSRRWTRSVSNSTPHAFADHHVFSTHDLAYPDCDAVLMTEKDAVKCRALGRNDLFALRVEARVDSKLADFIVTRLHGLKAA